VSSTGASCSVCHDQADACERCGGRAIAALAGPAAVRGHLWAERVVRALVARWPSSWPRSPRAVLIARSKVTDLSADEALRARLARICLDAAARRYAEMIDYLFRRRLEPPPSTDDETPE
jgi:hypothetical protein